MLDLDNFYYKEFYDDISSISSSIDQSFDVLENTVSQLKSYQEQIELAKDYWEATFNAVNICIAVLDKESKIIYANKKFLDTVLKDISQVEGKIICTIFCNRSCEQDAPCINVCAQEIVQRQSSYYRVAFNQIYGKSNNLIGCVFTATDITDERRALSTCKEFADKYSNIFNHAFDPILLVDIESQTIIEGNTAACNYYGYTTSEFHGLCYFRLSAQPEVSLERIFKLHEPNITNITHKRKDNTLFEVEISLSYFTVHDRQNAIIIVRPKQPLVQ